MDSPLLTLIIAIFFGFLTLIVESQGNVSPPPPPPPSPPPPTSPPPPPYSPPPPLRSPPPPTPPASPSPSRPPPPPRKRLHPTPPRGQHGDHEHRRKRPSPPPPPPPKREKINTGKKVGLMFIGVAAILQVCVISFLFISRRQLLKAESVN
ncbi:hypothetical protein C2S51_006559 [Perilla frutescens var. frutescens]|nr:hypothetical protein C2S51_006559 [Perilla frutescens var. frutescens]